MKSVFFVGQDAGDHTLRRFLPPNGGAEKEARLLCLPQGSLIHGDNIVNIHALFHRFIDPFIRLCIVLLYAFSPQITPGNGELRICQPLFRGLHQHLKSLPVILLDTVAVVIAGAEDVLRIRAILPGGLFKPFDRLTQVLLHAVPVCIAKAEIELGVTVVRQFLKDGHCLGVRPVFKQGQGLLIAALPEPLC